MQTNSSPTPIVSIPPAIAPPTNWPTSRNRVLLVDDDVSLLKVMRRVLEAHGFEVVSANVNEALKHIAMTIEPFEVLISDLHMPGHADGLIVANAMRQSNPKAITVVMSGYPDMTEAAATILLQADHILLKPIEFQPLIALIREKLASRALPRTKDTTETVATILERTGSIIIAQWLKRVEGNEDLARIALTVEERTGHLPRLMQDLVHRLRQPQSLECGRIDSSFARKHGALRRKQGYSVALIVEESRMLQVSIFQILQNNLKRADFSQLLMNVMVIADEVDWQLTQAVRCYVDLRRPVEPQAA